MSVRCLNRTGRIVEYVFRVSESQCLWFVLGEMRAFNGLATSARHAAKWVGGGHVRRWHARSSP
jgi:hypothetical protein